MKYFSGNATRGQCVGLSQRRLVQTRGHLGAFQVFTANVQIGALTPPNIVDPFGDNFKMVYWDGNILLGIHFGNVCCNRDILYCIGRYLQSKLMNSHSAILHCLADGFILEPSTLVENPNGPPAQQLHFLALPVRRFPTTNSILHRSSWRTLRTAVIASTRVVVVSRPLFSVPFRDQSSVPNRFFILTAHPWYPTDYGAISRYRKWLSIAVSNLWISVLSVRAPQFMPISRRV